MEAFAAGPIVHNQWAIILVIPMQYHFNSLRVHRGGQSLLQCISCSIKSTTATKVWDSRRGYWTEASIGG